MSWVQLATSAVDTSILADTAVTAAKIAADAVTTTKILDANMTTAKIAAGAVGTTQLADLSVTTAKLAAEVKGFSIVFGAVTTGLTEGFVMNTAPCASETTCSVLIPTAVKASNLRVLSGASNATYTVHKNLVATPLSITLAGTTTGSNTTAEVSFASGDTLAIQFTGGAGNFVLLVSLTLTPA